MVASSQISSPNSVVILRKTVDGVGFCCDFIKLTEITTKNSQTFPRIDQNFFDKQKTLPVEIFMDLSTWCYAFEKRPSVFFLAWVIKVGSIGKKSVQFVLCNDRVTFQRAMHTCVAFLNGKYEAWSSATSMVISLRSKRPLEKTERSHQRYKSCRCQLPVSGVLFNEGRSQVFGEDPHSGGFDSRPGRHRETLTLGDSTTQRSLSSVLSFTTVNSIQRMHPNLTPWWIWLKNMPSVQLIESRKCWPTQNSGAANPWHTFAYGHWR